MKVDPVQLDLYRLNLVDEPPDLPEGMLEVERLLASGLGWEALELLESSSRDPSTKSLTASQLAYASYLMAIYRASRYVVAKVPGAAMGNALLLATWPSSSQRPEDAFRTVYPDELVSGCRFEESYPIECPTSNIELLLAGLATVVLGELDHFVAYAEVSPRWQEMRGILQAGRAFHQGDHSWPYHLEDSRHYFVHTYIAVRWKEYHRANPDRATAWLERQVRKESYHRQVTKTTIRRLSDHRRLPLFAKALYSRLRIFFRKPKLYRRIFGELIS